MTASDVGIIGPGRAGMLIAAAASTSRLRVRAVAGGSQASRAALTQRIAGCRNVDTPSEIARLATLIVIATPDDAIEGVVRQLAVDDVLGSHHQVIHLSGVLGLEPLRLAARAGAGVAACHPAVTIPSGAAADILIGAPWGVTASEDDRAWAHELVTRLGGEPYRIAEHDRVIYHAALAVASNAVGAAVSVARQLLLATGISQPEQFLRPLVTSSASNVLVDGAAALTGPIARGDVATVRSHLAHIDSDLPEVSMAYRWMARVVLQQVRHQLDDQTYQLFVEAIELPDSKGVS